MGGATHTNMPNLGHNIYYLEEPLIYDFNTTTPINEIIAVLSRKSS